MSRHGDNNEFMNELSDALESRAKEVGARKAMQEVAEVIRAFCEYYWPEDET